MMKFVRQLHYTHKQVEHGALVEDELPNPMFHSDQAAGIDLRAAISYPITLQPGEDIVIPSGLKIHIGSKDIDYANVHDDVGGRTETYAYFGDMFNVYGMVVPRSGLGCKHYVRLANTAGIIDADYQGEIFIKIRNEGTIPLTVSRGDRICQMVFNVCLKPFKFEEVEDFEVMTKRGEMGFGSSGVK